MNNKDYIKRVYRNFSEFVSESSAKGLEYFVLNSKFTTNFNNHIRDITEEIKQDGKMEVEFSILFNTDGEIAIIDSYLIGKHIGNNYKMKIEAYYKENSLNKIVKSVVNGSNKSKKDFLVISYNTINNVLRSIYCELKCNKEIITKYVEFYRLVEDDHNELPIKVASILIIEDICKYIGINDLILMDTIDDMFSSKSSQ